MTILSALTTPVLACGCNADFSGVNNSSSNATYSYLYKNAGADSNDSSYATDCGFDVSGSDFENQTVNSGNVNSGNVWYQCGFIGECWGWVLGWV
ncbi:hypothetical protein [Methanolapillus millepedarum]|uniref:Uncharacterized protein n=1 Tax=Methanolapillus millepedarum TaxID=3028296 RepID=A0AA96ZUU9_9EURY|nr:hypothetical protein MsAc7_02500 [Methanosarcinaceae archaeon Ac7]